VSSTPKISYMLIERNTCAPSSRRILSRSGQGQDSHPRLSCPSHPGSRSQSPLRPSFHGKK
jgi:hypothetical protein